jgi:glycogen operon protein
MEVAPGTPYPFGATWDGEGVNFALFSENATAVELCLFEAPEAPTESTRVRLVRSGDVWHARVGGVGPGQAYGYRVHGPWAPEAGHRFNPRKLLVDPHARALCGALRWDDALLGHHPARPREPDPRDSAPFVPRGLVLDPAFDWEGDRPPRTPWSRTVLYECHVKGMTARHPDVPPAWRGSFLGLAAEPVIEHLLGLGVTALELMPLAHHALDPHLASLGLPNYWGYMTLGFCAPDARFASGDRGQQVAEFREMVKRLHRAGLEVILDVVFNHTPEGGPLGPTLSLRGIDDASYYRQRSEDPSAYLDLTGCGNTVDTSHPRVRQLVVDCLRYWVAEMHVDGFRFDLATVLARDPFEFDPFGRIFELLRQDPVLAPVKLIAEPWDLGPGGYQLGRFPRGWSEWNGRFRDVVRRAWRGDAGQLPELASRLAGSSDLFDAGGRPPQASVNFVTCHDGMTLRDLVTYSHKHNEANGEQGRDGPHDDSHNWGAEGPSRAPRVAKLRERARRNLMATLLLSQGVPMLSHGDELGRTQHGNNNAYCQDNELTWVDWNLDESGRAFLDFVRSVLALRRDNAVFRRRHFFRGEDALPGGRDDVTWLRPDGAEMEAADWSDPGLRTLAMWIPADAAEPADETGRPQRAESVLLLLNTHDHTRAFSLPAPEQPGVWHEQLNTACHTRRALPGRRILLAPHSLALLVWRAT